MLDLGRQAVADAPRHIERAVEWLRENAKPPPGVKLVSTDRRLYSGVAFVDRNDVVVLVAARQQGARSVQRRAPIPLSSSPSYSTNRRLFEDDDPGDGWPPDPYVPQSSPKLSSELGRRVPDAVVPKVPSVLPQKARAVTASCAALWSKRDRGA